MSQELTQEYLKSILHYDPDTGVFRWAVRRAKWIPAGTVAGSTCEKGYSIIVINYKIYRAHRLAWFYMTGSHPPEFIDHINLDRKDNRFCNLRLSTRAQNMQNFRIRPDNKSGVKGVYWDAKSNGWRAAIQKDKKRIYLGVFTNLSDASDAIRAAREVLHGEFANHG